MKSAWLRGVPLLLLLIGAVWAGTSLPAARQPSPNAGGNLSADAARHGVGAFA